MWVLIWEIPAQQIILGELRVEVLHREFLVMRHLHIVYVRLLDQLLLVREHLLEEVLVDELLRRQVELEAVDKVASWSVADDISQIGKVKLNMEE